MRLSSPAKILLLVGLCAAIGSASFFAGRKSVENAPLALKVTGTPAPDLSPAELDAAKLKGKVVWKHVRPADSSGAHDVVFDHTGRFVFEATEGIGDYGGISVLSAASGQTVHRLPSRSGGCSSVALSVDGRLLTFGNQGDRGDDRVFLFQVDGWKNVWVQESTYHHGGATSLVLSPDQRLLAACNGPYSRRGRSGIRLWNTHSGALQLVIEGQQEAFYGLAFRPDGEILVAGGTGGITLWQVSNGRLLRRWAEDLKISSFALCPSGQRAAVGTAQRIALYRLADGVPLWTRRVVQGSHVQTSVAFTRDGRIVSSAGDETVRIWGAKDGALLQQLQSPLGMVRRVAVSRDGKQVAAACREGLVAWQ